MRPESEAVLFKASCFCTCVFCRGGSDAELDTFMNWSTQPDDAVSFEACGPK